MNDDEARYSLRAIIDAAIKDASPREAVLRNLPDKPKGRCVVIGAGKASAAMAATLDEAWPDVDVSGVVSTRYGHAVSTRRIKIIEAGHPEPDENSLMAAEYVLAALRNLNSDDLVIAMISGGGSATLCAPIDGISFHEKQSITRALLKCGASIAEFNTVRQHISKIKGGGLIHAAAPAKLVSLIISDVPGDDAALIASGPTAPTHTTPKAAIDVLNRYKINVPEALRRRGSDQRQTIQQFSTSDCRIIASPASALFAAADTARALGIEPVLLGDAIECESRELGRAMAGIANSVRTLSEPRAAPCALISGGETTVTIGEEGAGRGGRNLEFVLSLSIALEGAENIWAIACDSDGIDGTEDAAGAVVTPNTLSRAQRLGLDPRDALRRHDSYSFFGKLGDLVLTGPTLTNVNDVRVVLVST